MESEIESEIESEMCSICQEDLIGTSNTLITKCNHKFHTDCYIKYLNSSHKNCCPICRRNIFDGKIETNPTQLFEIEHYNHMVLQHQINMSSMVNANSRLLGENKLLLEKNKLLEDAMNPQQKIQYEEMKMNELKRYDKKKYFLFRR